MKVAHVWSSAQKNLYDLGIRGLENGMENPDNPTFNVYLKSGEILKNSYVRSFDSNGAKFFDRVETTMTVAGKNLKKIELVRENGNKTIYEWQPCRTWNSFCNFLNEEYNLPPGLSGHCIATPELTVVTRFAGCEFEGRVLGYNRGKIRLDMGSELPAWDIKKDRISEVREGDETVYKD